MTFQAHSDNIQKFAAKTSNDFRTLAERKGLIGPGVRATQFVTWLAEDVDLRRGHSMALWAC